MSTLRSNFSLDNSFVKIRDLGIYLLFLVACVIGAYLAGHGKVVFVALYVSTLCGLLLLYKPDILLWFTLISGLIIAGLAQLYWPQLQIIRWVVSLLTLVIGALAIIEYAFKYKREKPSSLLWWIIAFFTVTLFSSFINFVDFNTFVFGVKGYFQVYGLFIALALLAWDKGHINFIPKFLILLGLIQLPFALHQYFFIVPTRIGLGDGIVPEDVIAGTFGASATGGGANAVLTALLLIVMSIVTALWKRGVLPISKLALLMLFLIIPIMLNLSKISLVYIVIAYIILFRDEIRDRPAIFVFGGVFAALMVSAILASYLLVSTRGSDSQGVEEFLNSAIEDNVSEGHGHGNLLLNRWTTITYWFGEQAASGDVGNTLFGYGAGASREGTGGVSSVSTLAQNKYPGVGIGLTAISALLWDTGIVGMALVFAIFFSAYSACRTLTEYYHVDKWKASIFHGLQVAIVIFTLSLFHKSSFVFHISYQVLLMLVFGYIAYWHKQMKNETNLNLSK